MKTLRHIIVAGALTLTASGARASGLDSLMNAAVDSLYLSAMQPLELHSDLFGDTPDVTELMERAPMCVSDGFADRMMAEDLMHLTNPNKKEHIRSIYNEPYSLTGTCYNWRRLWVNTGVLTGAFVGTLFVLELLPEDATSWNRAELQKVPMFKRWRQHVIEEGPEWDHDKFMFNYVLHPYAGAAYFMSARSCGFNFYQSMLYSAIISTVGWEFGIEAFMERPSYQDLFITPIVGSALGEGFYRLKRHLVDNDYRLFGSKVVGNIVAFIIDPINEVIGLFHYNEARAVSREKTALRADRRKATFSLNTGLNQLSLRVTF